MQKKLPKTPKEAARLGSPRYFTGKPCTRGHISERSTSSRGCVECLYASGLAFRNRDPISYAAKNKASKKRRQLEIIAYSRKRYSKNKAAVRAATEKWRIANLDKDAAKAARRKAARLRACPPWADHQEIEKFYAAARSATELTGILHEVDHIHPLQGENLCGLHVPWNLQILTKSENSRKKNKMIDAALSPAKVDEAGN